MLDKLKFWQKYPIDVIILEQRHGGVMKTQDQAVRITEQDGHEYYELKNKGDKIKPSNYDNIIPNRNGKSTVFLLKTDSDEYLPWKPEFDKKKVETNLIEDKRERLNWLIQEKERVAEKYTALTWISEHKDLVMLIGTAVGLAIIFYGAAKLFGQVGPQMQALTDQLSLTNQLLEQTPGGVPP